MLVLQRHLKILHIKKNFKMKMKWLKKLIDLKLGLLLDHVEG